MKSFSAMNSYRRQKNKRIARICFPARFAARDEGERAVASYKWFNFLIQNGKPLGTRRPAYRWNNDEGRSRGSRDVYREQPSSKERSKLPPDHPFLLIVLVSECPPPCNKKNSRQLCPSSSLQIPTFLQIIPSISIFGKSESGSFTALEKEDRIRTRGWSRRRSR